MANKKTPAGTGAKKPTGSTESNSHLPKPVVQDEPQVIGTVTVGRHTYELLDKTPAPRVKSGWTARPVYQPSRWVQPTIPGLEEVDG
jgi:hypothetical protein